MTQPDRREKESGWSLSAVDHRCEIWKDAAVLLKVSQVRDSLTSAHQQRSSQGQSLCAHFLRCQQRALRCRAFSFPMFLLLSEITVARGQAIRAE